MLLIPSFRAPSSPLRWRLEVQSFNSLARLGVHVLGMYEHIPSLNTGSGSIILTSQNTGLPISPKESPQAGASIFKQKYH
ncbi:hypothetical protein RDI58_018610 [Solanum bulbocastanum]|uniref:Uncharacterized protein n=1 Tax=Solanum bulbocastanum TaxID=147425 RepID=A0AAN8Y9W6_SOLBU